MKYKKAAKTQFSIVSPMRLSDLNQKVRSGLKEDHDHHHHHGHLHHGHHHHGHHHHGHSQVGMAFFLNLFFSIVEIIGGIYSGSYAILADALHDLGDSFTFGVAWCLERYSRKTPDSRHTYGYARYSLLGTIFVSGAVIVSSGFIIMGAIQRFGSPKIPAPMPMILLALLGVAVNGYAYFKLAASSNFLDKSLKWHMLEDALGWIGVLIGGVVIYFTGWNWLDPVLAIVISCFVSWNVVKTALSTLDILLQATPPATNLEVIRDLMLTVEGVKAVHDLHVWSLNGTRQILTTHIVTQPEVAPGQVKQAVRSKLKKLGQFHCTIEIESPNDTCDDVC
jgi:cobalt-zinc-cadmium efflux system protein